MKLNEEQKIALEAGEFIHTIANRLITDSIYIENMNNDRAQIIMEISEVLRCRCASDEQAPLLKGQGFLITQHPRSSWIDIACRLLDAPESQDISDIIKQVTKE